MRNLLLELQKELELSQSLLEKASRLASPKKNEDGSRKPTTKKKRKKQTLTPEQKKKQKKNQKLVTKVKEKLKARRYKSKETGKDLSFNTALTRKHPKAEKDFNSAMEKARKSDKGDNDKGKGDSDKDTPLSDAQKDIVNRVLSGNRKFDDLSVVEEESLKDALSLLSDIGVVLGIELDGNKDGGETKTDQAEDIKKIVKKKRETRSDKGKERGSYKKELKKEVLNELLPEEAKGQVDTEALSDLSDEEVSDTTEVLEERIEKRKPRSDKGEEKGSRNKKPKKFIEGEKLTDQPKSVQKQVIKNMLEGAMVSQLDPNARIQQVNSMLEQKGLLSEFEKKSLQKELDVLKALPKNTEELLPSTQRGSRTLGSEISKAVDSLSDLSEDQVEQMVESYAGFSQNISSSLKKQGIKGLKEFLESESKDLKVPQPPTKPNAQNQSEYAHDLGVYLAVTNAKKGIVENPLFGLKNVPDGDLLSQEEHFKLVRREQGERFRTLDKEERNSMVLETTKRIKELELELNTDPNNKDLLSDLKNLKTSEEALNTVRMISGEGVIEGYSEIPDSVLELARQTESNAWDEAISALSTMSASPSDVREQVSNVVNKLNDDDFASVMGGSNGPYGEMLETMDDGFCPASPANNAKSVGGGTLKPGESCPNPMPPHIKKMLRDYMTGSFVNLHSVEKDGYGDRGSSKETSKLTTRQKKEISFFWKERKDKFFQAFVDGVDEKGKELSDSEKEAYAEQFRLEWVEQDLKGIEVYKGSGKKYQWQQLQVELKKIKSYPPKMRKQRSKEIREQLEKLFDEGVSKKQETPKKEVPKKKANIFNNLFIDTHYKSGGSNTMQKKSTVYVDYQERSKAFQLGMRVYPFLGGNPARSGIVVSVFPAIGMVDVQFPHGSQRFPVEDLVVDTSGDYQNLINENTSVPGGVGTTPVTSIKVVKQARRVTSRYFKQALYWYAKDRTYRQCRNEVNPSCPKCKTPLGKTVYKRRDSRSERLLACHTCLFIIKPSDIVGG
jgi:hypothetical protein